MVVPARWVKWLISCSLLKSAFACCYNLPGRVEMLRCLRAASLSALLISLMAHKAPFEGEFGFPSSASQQESLVAWSQDCRLHICGSASPLRGTTPISQILSPPSIEDSGTRYGLSPEWQGYEVLYLVLSSSYIPLSIYRIEDYQGSRMDCKSPPTLFPGEIHFLPVVRHMAYTHRTEICDFNRSY